MRVIRAVCKRKCFWAAAIHLAAALFVWSIRFLLIRVVSENVLCTVIDVEVIVAKEPDESDVEVFCDLHGKTGWSTNTGDHRESAHESFLKKFEAGTSGEQEQCMAQGSAVCEELRSQELVDRVVSPHVFFDTEEFAC